MQSALLVALLVYLVVVLSMAFVLKSRIQSEEDFLIGGRSFGLWLTTFSLFATWFGAGTLIAATDEVYASGLQITALEPYGAGMCLILSSLLIAKPLWRMGIVTYSDFYRIKFGQTVEKMSVFINIPVYVGWIAVQIITLAHLLQAFFPFPLWVFIVLISLLSVVLTMTGGLWSVSITDSFQIVIIVGGLLYLFMKVFGLLPTGWLALLDFVPSENLVFFPTENVPELLAWLSLFSVSALGNMTGQDMVQRLLSAKSEDVASLGCFLSGVMYIVFGSIPVLLGLTAGVTLGEFEGSVVPQLIQSYLDPVTGVVLIMTIVSAIVSTITSALLAPSSLLSHNYLKHRFPGVPLLTLSRWSVVGVMVLSLITVVLGEDLYSLLENSYAVGFVGFFVPMTIGVFTPYLNQRACIVSMCVSILIWLGEFAIGGDAPYALIAVAAGYPVYFIVYIMGNENKANT